MTAQESRISPRPPQHLTAGLSGALFGSLGVLLAFWNLWCLELLSTTVAADIAVVSILTLVAGYDIHLVRRHKLRRLTPLSPQGRIKAWLFWGATVLFIYQLIWQKGSPVSGLLGLLTALEAMCFFIHFLDVRQAPRLQMLVLLQSLLHLLGWLLLTGLFFYGFRRYAADFFGLNPGEYFQGLPPFLCRFLQGWISRCQVRGTVFAGALMVLAAFCLRLCLEARLCAIPFRSLFGRTTLCIFAFFLSAVVFSAVSRHILLERHSDALNAWKAFAGKTPVSPLVSATAESEVLSERQKKLGKRVVSLEAPYLALPSPGPYVWGLFCTRQDLSEIPEFFHQKSPLDDSSRAALEEHRALLADVFQELDALEAELPAIPDARLSQGTLLLEQWRFLAAIRLEDLNTAQASLDAFREFSRHLLEQQGIYHRVRAFQLLTAWGKMGRLLPETEWRRHRENEKKLREEIGNFQEKPLLLHEVQTTHDFLEELRSDFHSWGPLMSFYENLILVDETKLLRNLTGRERLSQRDFSPREIGLHARLVCDVLIGFYLQNKNILLAHLDDADWRPSSVLSSPAILSP